VKVHCAGGYYVWDSDQETPNFQTGTIEYADGTILDFTANNLYAPPNPDTNVFFTTERYLTGGRRASTSAQRTPVFPGDLHAGRDRYGVRAERQPVREFH
jgi:hypothetical protein